MRPSTAHAQSGSAAAPEIDWPATLATHDRWLRTVVRARLGEWQAVDEVMQEISLAVVTQRSPLCDASKLAPWLYRLAVQQVLQYRRKQGRRRKLTDRFAHDRQPTEVDRRAVDPLDWLLADERGQMVRASLEKLPRRDAEILLLKYSENWSYQEIACRLGVSHSAVEARLHRARGRLRAKLATLNVVEV